MQRQPEQRKLLQTGHLRGQQNPNPDQCPARQHRNSPVQSLWAKMPALWQGPPVRQLDQNEDDVRTLWLPF